MIRFAVAEIPTRAFGYVFAATAAAAVDPHTVEIGQVYVLRVFGAEIHVFPVLVSIFAMLAIRQLMRSRTESWRESVVLSFALSLLLIASIVQFKMGVAYATGLGFGLGAAGMAVVGLFKDGVVRFYKGMMDRIFNRKDPPDAPPPAAPARRPRAPRTPPPHSPAGNARAMDDDDVTELHEEIARIDAGSTRA